jgi:hypothetical protein
VRNRDHDAAADKADPRSARRPECRGNPRHDRRKPRQPGARLSRPDRALLSGTRLGRQELDAELLDDMPGAMWQRGIVEATRTSTLPELSRVVVAIDPAASASEDADDFAHHAEVAALPVGCEIRLLDLAEKARWSRKELRQRVQDTSFDTPAEPRTVQVEATAQSLSELPMIVQVIGLVRL